jgi:hypothetical protein
MENYTGKRINKVTFDIRFGEVIKVVTEIYSLRNDKTNELIRVKAENFFLWLEKQKRENKAAIVTLSL